MWIYGQTSRRRPYVARWNGKAWTTKQLPGSDVISTLLVRGAKNIWYFTDNGKAGHYNGTVGRPRRPASPFFPPQGPGKTVWAAGYNEDTQTPRISTWNGTAWTPAVLPGNFGAVSGITAFSTRNVWAAGNGEQGAVLLHGNGTTWRAVKAPTSALRRDRPRRDRRSVGHLVESGIYHYVKGRWTRAAIKSVPRSKNPLIVTDWSVSRAPARHCGPSPATTMARRRRAHPPLPLTLPHDSHAGRASERRWGQFNSR